MAENIGKEPLSPSPASDAVSFSHVHLYVDKLEDLGVYKALEDRLNIFSDQAKDIDAEDTADCIQQKQNLWKSLLESPSDTLPFVPQNRDVVKQLLAGFGFRVTGVRYNDMHGVSSNTRSVLVTSCDPRGVQILVTAVDKGSSVEKDEIDHFDAGKIQHFLKAHDGRQGIAVLAFSVDNLEAVYDRYQRLHPKLVSNFKEHDSGTKVLEVYAYYNKHSDIETNKTADTGTVLRFLQLKDATTCALPGLTAVDATFEDTSNPAYCDHWVSNVFSRTEFLDTLKDTLGFTPKVDFNAGVVAAGEAQIESTVTGNETAILTSDKEKILRDQSQVYLPINNALSKVGHVHGFLEEIGQGVQHVASRVENLVDFVQRANDMRKITNEGFTFLRIPRSYYGILTSGQLVKGKVGVGEGCARAIVGALHDGSVLAKDGAVDLEMTRNDLDKVLEESLASTVLEEYREKRASVLDTILSSRYKNLYSLLGHHLSEKTYLGIVRNQILVDIQGEDLLFQIFTANILQRKTGEEAPFFEFIQRVCSECTDENGCPQKVKPGCGGFGIRNFLTLFLSIEVSKSMQEVTDARIAGDTEGEKYAQAMVDGFTDQLNESNPILTEIADAMTEEGYTKERMLSCLTQEDSEEAAIWKAKMESAAERKRNGNEKLLECSSRYNDLMKSIRESRKKSRECMNT